MCFTVFIKNQLIKTVYAFINVADSLLHVLAQIKIVWFNYILVVFQKRTYGPKRKRYRNTKTSV